MDFDYTDTQKSNRKEIVDFCRGELNDGIGERDRCGEFPREHFEKIGAHLKLQGLAVAKEFGGRALDPLTAIVALEAFGYACEDSALVLAVCAQLLAVSVPIQRFATDAQRKSLLPDLCSGRKTGVSAMSGAEPNSNLGIVETSALADGDDFILNGTKSPATNAPAGELGLILAVTDPEADLEARFTVFLVDWHLPGITRTAATGEIRFENVRLAATSILGGVAGTGMVVSAHAINWERIGLFAAHVGTMQRLTEASIKQARKLKKLGEADATVQAASDKIVDMKLRLETARLLTYEAASRLEKSSNDVALGASIAKLFVSEALFDTTRDHLQIQGSTGFTNDGGGARPLQDAIGATLCAGTSETQRSLIAAELGL